MIMINKEFKYTKECAICSKEFGTNIKTSKYCSDECRKVATKNRTYKLVCQECGVEFDGKTKTNKFCSEKCRTKNLNERYEVICSQCGVVFRSPCNVKEYPCKKCSDLLESTKVEKVCKVCGKIFKANDEDICSEYCNYQYKRYGEYQYNINREELESSEEKIKEILISYSGVRLNKKEQTEIYKKIKSISNLPDHKTITKCLKRCEIPYTYFDNVDGWSPLLIGDQDNKIQILIDVKKQLLQQTINDYEVAKEQFEREIEELKYTINQLEGRY